MDDFADIATKLRERLAELIDRADDIEEDLRQPLDADFSEQAVDLADDEALEGVEGVLRAEARQVRAALARIDGCFVTLLVGTALGTTPPTVGFATLWIR